MPKGLYVIQMLPSLNAVRPTRTPRHATPHHIQPASLGGRKSITSRLTLGW